MSAREEDLERRAAARCGEHDVRRDCLRWAGGNVEGALLAELGRIEIEEGVLDGIWEEWLEAQGLRSEGRMKRLREAAAGGAVELVECALEVLRGILEGRDGLRFRFGKARLLHEVDRRDFDAAVRMLKDVLTPLLGDDVEGALAEELKNTAVLLVFLEGARARREAREVVEGMLRSIGQA